MRGPQVPEYMQQASPSTCRASRSRRSSGSWACSEIVKLASNENPLGTSPKALAAVDEGAARRCNRYPDGGGFVLRRALAARHGVDLDQVILGNGSFEIIEMLARAYVADGDEAVSRSSRSSVYEHRGQPGQRPARLRAGDRRARSRPPAHGRGGHRAHQARLPRQPLQPDRHLLHPRRARRVSSARSATTCWSCSTRPTWSTSTSPTTRMASTTSRPGRTCSSCAPSRRSTAWPACASATAWRSPEVIADLNTRALAVQHLVGGAGGGARRRSTTTSGPAYSREHNLRELTFLQEELTRRGVRVHAVGDQLRARRVRRRRQAAVRRVPAARGDHPAPGRAGPDQLRPGLRRLPRGEREVPARCWISSSSGAPERGRRRGEGRGERGEPSTLEPQPGPGRGRIWTESRAERRRETQRAIQSELFGT